MLVSVAAVRKLDDDGWAKSVNFRQIFTTQEAVNITDNRGGGPKGHLGKKDLERWLKKDQREGFTTYHNGDYLHSGDIRDVIGVV